MRILLATTDFPLPADAGGVVRALGLSTALAERGHELTLLARLRTPGTTPGLVDDLSVRLGGAPVAVFGAPHLPPPPGAARSAGRWAWAAATGTPPWVWTARSRALAARARALAPGFDAALLLDDHAHTYAADLAPLLPVVVDKQNVLAASWNAVNHWSPDRPGVRARAQQALAFGLVRRWERRVLTAADGVVVTSDDEVARLRAEHGLEGVAVPSSIDLPATAADPRRAGPNVLWLGDGRYGANEEGLLRFLREGWRPLGERGLCLQVVGRDPSDAVRSLAEGLPGVRLLGFVNDLAPLVRGASAAVVPLWRGAGIKMKTLVLMGSGLPVVATPTGLEGIAAQDGTHVQIAQAPSGLAAAIGDLVADRERGAAMGAAARALIAKRHTWDAVVAGMEAELGRVAERRAG